MLTNWYIFCRKIGFEKMRSRSIQMMEVSVAEAPAQSATFCSRIPESEDDMVDIESLVTKFRPQPCSEKEV